MRTVRVSLPFFVILTLFTVNSFSATSVSQYGITWYFSADRTVGQFANGDYWVLGPVTITRITPDFDGENNGWEVNPTVAGNQGFQDGCSGGAFDENLIPDLPYTSPSSGIVSIVKTTPSGSSRPCIQTAAVLTVVTEIPPDNGAGVFRPPYIASDKPLYSLDDLRTDLLPKYEITSTIRQFISSVSDIASWFQKLRLDHKGGKIGRALRPADAMDDYQPKNTIRNNSAALFFMLDHGSEDIMPALIQFIQTGIDNAYIILDGQTWPAGDGHEPDRIILAAYAATLLDIQAAKDTLLNATFFHATKNMAQTTREGSSLWGMNSTETGYWSYVRELGGNRSQEDPYSYIDGGKCGVEYQDGTSQSHKGEILCAHMMPELQGAWPIADLATATDYADRWVNLGIWSQPDPCAPVEGTYEVDYGPDPNHAGRCILDKDLEYYNGPDDFKCKDGAECGRYPEKHGTKADAGMYRSDFVAAVWNAYRGPSCYDGICEAGETCEYDCGPIRVTDSLPLRNGIRFRITNNPFHRASGALFITVSGSQQISGYVTDGRGMIVTGLVNNGGELVWDGTDRNGIAVTPGIYLIYLSDGGTDVVEKVAIVE